MCENNSILDMLAAGAEARGGRGSAVSGPPSGGAYSSSSRYGDADNGGSSHGYHYGDDRDGGSGYAHEEHSSSSYSYPPEKSTYGDRGYDDYKDEDGGYGHCEPPSPPKEKKDKWVFVLKGWRPQGYQQDYYHQQGNDGYGGYDSPRGY